MRDIATIISQLEKQRTSIDRALAALREIDSAGPRKAAAKHRAPAKAHRKKRRLSPEGRQRIIEATKRRWAAKRAADKRNA